MARPKKPFDWGVLDGVLQYESNLKDCADLLNVSEDTVERRIKAMYKITFSEYRASKLGKVKIKLVQKAITQALEGNSPAVLIFCLKNLCKWTDRQEIEHGNKGGDVFKFNFKLDDKPSHRD